MLLRGPDGYRLAFDLADHLDDLGSAPYVALADGNGLSGVPDLTGDGVPDVLVPIDDYGLPGRIHLVPGPIVRGSTLSIEGTRSWAGIALDGRFGGGDVADLDGDGLNDLVVTAHADGYGAMYVIWGTDLFVP